MRGEGDGVTVSGWRSKGGSGRRRMKVLECLWSSRRLRKSGRRVVINLSLFEVVDERRGVELSAFALLG